MRVIGSFYKTDADWPLVVDIICRRNTALAQNNNSKPQEFKRSEEWKAKKLERLRHKQDKIRAEIARNEVKLQWISKVIDHVETGSQHPRFGEGGEETWRRMIHEMRQRSCDKERRGCGNNKDAWKQRKHEMKEERRRGKEAWKHHKMAKRCGSWEQSNNSSDEERNERKQIWKQKKHEMKEERKRWKEANKCQRRSLKRADSSSSSGSSTSSEEDRGVWKEMKKQWKQEKRRSFMNQ
eukprot:TRINITY_DN1914_c0_g3_i1.p1 TRINITY_DN1914_c0_g3~~TRINITY_DN1914_c0_g3_i1.p1  ORF type:complete len:271 (+),score=96.09 TRINITY_DN1914_c0_g3_i1:102-815(+)